MADAKEGTETEPQKLECIVESSLHERVELISVQHKSSPLTWYDMNPEVELTEFVNPTDVGRRARICRQKPSKSVSRVAPESAIMSTASID
jgi:hypothetical protein